MWPPLPARLAGGTDCSSSTLPRTSSTGLTSPTFTYTAAMQSKDFSESYPVSAFVVYQVTRAVSFADDFCRRVGPCRG